MAENKEENVYNVWHLTPEEMKGLLRWSLSRIQGMEFCAGLEQWVVGWVGKKDGAFLLLLGFDLCLSFGQPEIRLALDMSNKTSGKRPASTSNDIVNHSMVSEVPPERPNVRVSPAFWAVSDRKWL